MIQPSLQIGGGDWAVKETKLLGTNPLLNEKLPVEIDVTNATIGTRVNKQGFIENGPKNLLLYSQSIGSGSWIFNSNTLSVINSTNSKDPNGGFTASYLTFNGQFAGCKQSVKVEIGKTYTISVWAKSDTNTNLLQFWAEASPQTSLGAFTPTNDWVRYQSTFVAYYTLQTPIAFAQDRNTSNFGSLWLWGAQLEEGSVATEYYPTTTRTNLARIDYSSGEAALLIEPQRTNLLLQSEALSNTAFLQPVGATTTTVSILNPANSSSCTEYRLSNITTDDQFVRINPNTTYNSGVTYSYSIFVKYGSFRFCKLSYINFSGSYAVAVFDLVNGVLGTTAVSNIGSILNNSSIQSLKNGWFRISISATLNSSAGQPMNFEFNKVTSANPIFFNFGREIQTTTTSDFCYLDRAQLEVGTYPTSYIPTLASAVTRNADVISKNEISTLPTNYPFTMYAKGIFNIKNASLLSFSDTSSTASVFSIGMDNTSNVYAVSRPNNNQSLAIGPVINLGQHSIAAVFTTTQIKLYLNGALVNTSENTQPFKLEVKGLILGQYRIPGDTGIRAFVNEALIFNSALSDKECITLTTP